MHTFKIKYDPKKENAPIVKTPINCAFICSSLVKSVPKISKSLKNPTARVPQTPAPK